MTDVPAPMALRPGTPADAPACAAILDAWIEGTAWLPRPPDVHPAWLAP